MPANEQTWRNQKLLHTLFAVSGVALLVSTIWMLAADHFRPWKPYQRKYVGMEERLTKWREDQLTSEAYRERISNLESKLQAARRQPISDELINEFKQEVTADASRRQRWELAAAKGVDVDELPLEEEPTAESARLAAIDRLASDLDKAASEAEADDDNAELSVRVGDRRAALLDQLQETIRKARFREDTLLSDRKVAGAKLDAAKANLGLAVRDDRSLEEQELLQAEVTRLSDAFNALYRQHQEAGDHRKELQEIVARMQADELAIQSEIDAEQQEVLAVEASLADLRSGYFSSSFPFLGKKILELPILDAFNSPRQIENLWSEGLTIDYNFRRVRRFDRCTTCHQGIAKTAPGSASEPGYRIEREVQLVLTGVDPNQNGAAGEGDSGVQEDSPRSASASEKKPASLIDAYGIKLAEAGLLNDDDVTIMFVRPDSPAAKANLAPSAEQTAPLSAEALREKLLYAKSATQIAKESDAATPAGLLVGDVIVRVGNDLVTNRAQAERFLLDRAGEPLVVTVRRGAPHPYASHPRLDLFVGAMSPHSMAKFGCTICHEGQGSATAFQWASHTPDNPQDKEFWRRQYGWFDNVHWIYPMFPKRFAESACLKCHHDVAELEPSDRFPDPPAPKLVHGYNLIRKYGCFGCHEINGYDGPNRRIGPDMRLEPNYFAHAQNLLVRLPSFQEALDPEIARLKEQLAPQEKAVDDLLRRRAQLEAQRTPPASEPPAGAEAEAESPAADPAADAPQASPLDAEIAELNSQITAAEQEMAPARSQLAVLDVRLQKIRDVKRLAELIVRNPADDEARSELRQILEKDRPAPAPEGAAPENPEETPSVAPQFEGVFDEQVYAYIDLLKDVDTPGELRKVGPSLRYAAHKLDRAFLYDWIANPKSFRPTTRMPKFFGLWDHLEGDSLHRAEQYEPLEILGMSAYLMAKSQEFAYLDPAQPPAEIGVSAADGAASSSAAAGSDESAEGAASAQGAEPDGEDASGPQSEAPQSAVERGKRLFQTRGCLACHDHADFEDIRPYRPDDEIVQGPELSGLRAKFDEDRNPNGRKWLYSWIKEPSRYNPRTLMPDLFLEPYTLADGTWVDPVADIVEYLMSPQDASEGGESSETNPTWSPAPGTLVDLDPSRGAALEQFVLENLKETFSTSVAMSYVKQGIPSAMRAELKGAEAELLVEGPVDAGQLEKQKLQYIGRKAIGKYGCYGCHDIPGFEDAKPIGATLADWGRKDPARLAFEHIVNYLEHGHGHAKSGKVNAGHADHEAAPGADGADASGEDEHDSAEARLSGSASEHQGGESQQDELPEFYREALLGSHREGFIFQKLREPRSYDYHTTANKRYNELLRMPLFPFSDDDREAVITFLLGLVADPPSDAYVSSPAPRREAIVEGRKVLEKYNCGGCHALELDRWTIAYPHGQFENVVERSPTKAFPFLPSGVSEQELAASRTPDRRGRITVDLLGMPSINDNDALPIVYDNEGDPVEDVEGEFDPTTVGYSFQVWSPVALDGKQKFVDKSPLLIPQTSVQIERRMTQLGGNLARYLVSRVVAQEKESNPSFNKGSQAWGWLPPPLIGEGRKVQPDWLHSFLLDPSRIRPAAVMRMPKFNMSPDEATALVNYFAAVDNADYPHEFDYQLAGDYMHRADAAYAQLVGGSSKSSGEDDGHPDYRLDAAMRIVADKKTYCAQCHIIGNYTPQGGPKDMAPNLAEVFRRLRPGYTRDWIAQPESVLPYTGMPVNIPYDAEKAHLGGISQQIYPGSSIDQLQGLVDLLMRFDSYALKQTDIARRVDERTRELGGGTATTAANGASGSAGPSGAADDSGGGD